MNHVVLLVRVPATGWMIHSVVSSRKVGCQMMLIRSLTRWTQTGVNRSIARLSGRPATCIGRPPRGRSIAGPFSQA